MDRLSRKVFKDCQHRKELHNGCKNGGRHDTAVPHSWVRKNLKLQLPPTLVEFGKHPDTIPRVHL